ncbi:DUF1801 domain-containing protein [Paenibacillus sp. J5C_2022]|uniref:DUF1801 domain-containing protein n=1 Tax=Paenibacillus sp. J5C2022 TaxID=2977129 RepID=UPI0021CE54F7|nr:DUF1801 domain-containing protein [Paenibacillus sp. J5C2022]MCU6707279.1 DUF1801 domain-containing protein [Paenibacillus sp. J5C2022]
MNTIHNSKVANIFESYPVQIRTKLLFLRQLVFQTASETDEIEIVEETLKWSEPSYVTKFGSTLRIGWQKNNPHHYAMYFHCQTKLVETFKEIFGDLFRYEGNRAILFHENDPLPVDELKQCILLTLTYHKRKHLPLLGA